MSGFLCAMVGASFTITATPSRIRKTVYAIGNAQVATAQSKFGGASMLSDGTGDCLQVLSNADFAFGSGDFTIEFFIRPTTALTGTYNIWDQRATGAGGGVVPSIYITGSVLYYFTNSDNRIAYSITLQSGTWYHFALSRSSGSTKMFLDGTQVGSTYTDSNSYTTSQVVIGAYAATGSYTGSTPAYFDEMRVSNSARYTTTFTPTTSAFANDENTLLLIHADGTNASTVFTDDAGTQVFPPTAAFVDDGDTKLLLHFNGTNGATSTTDDNASGRTAQTITMTTSSLSTTQQKFGTASLTVDGTGGDRVTCPDSDDWDLQAAPRTFECWVYINSLTNASRGSTGSAIPKLFGHQDQSGNTYWAFGPNEAGGLTLYYWSGSNNFINSTSTNLTTGVWYHIALITTAAGAKGYVNGVEYLSSALSNTPTKGNTIFSIGSEFGQSMNAYIDEMRVSHVNRYT